MILEIKKLSDKKINVISEIPVYADKEKMTFIENVILKQRFKINSFYLWHLGQIKLSRKLSVKYSTKMSNLKFICILSTISDNDIEYTIPFLINEICLNWNKERIRKYKISKILQND